ncbi:MAG: glutamine amidotransferase, partial [Pirellulaceae bacterium]|nr:glutamine amidotransferase [Pirellulaceae bacterium]
MPILIDMTRSMELPLEGLGVTRWQKLTESLQASRPGLEKLAEQYDLQFFGFDSELVALSSSAGWPALPDGPVGAQSDYGFALGQVTERLRGERIAGCMILGDGVQNTDFPKVELPRAIREFSQLQAPLFAVPFGQAAEGDQVADIAVTNLPDQFAVFVKNEIEIQGVVEVRGFVNQEIPVQLVRVDRTGREELLQTKVIVARQGDERIPVDMTYTPSEAGDYRLILRAEPQSRELVVQNNELPAFLTVYEGGLRVLYLESESNYEQKYLRRSLAASQDLEVDFVWIDQRDRSRWPVDLVNQINDPQYDVFILGDIDSRALHDPGNFEQNLNALAKRVEQGKGLIMLGGEHSFGPGRYHSTPLSDLLPIQMQAYEAQDFNAPVNHSLHLERELTLRPAASHYLTRLAGEEESVWGKLPPLLGANRFTGVKPRTQILLETERGEPILVVGTVGGRVIAFAGDSTWRWFTLGDSQF